MYQFKSVTADDFSGICQLMRSEEELCLVCPNGKYPLTIEQVEELAEVRKELTVMMDKNKVIGFANLYNYVPQESAYIGNVVIDENYRYQGLGKELMLHMLKVAYEKYQLKTVKLSVFSYNAIALLLYSKLGFYPFDIEERYDTKDKRVALIHMQHGEPA